MLLVEFAVDYGNDWFVIPVELEVGSLYRTQSLIVTDSFGVRTRSNRPASCASHFLRGECFSIRIYEATGRRSQQRICFFCRRRW